MRHPKLPAALLFATFAALGVGCSCASEADPGSGDAGVGSLDASSLGGDGGASERDGGPRGDGGRLAFCEGSGPTVVGDPSIADCTGAIAEDVFRFALCTCEGYVGSHALTTDSFDSRMGPLMTPGSGGSVGTNGRMDTNAAATIGGSLWVSGTGIQAGAAGTLDIGGVLRVGGPLVSETSVEVAGDAFVAGRVSVGSLSVGGMLTLEPSATLEVRSGDAPTPVRASFDTSLPCECDDDVLVDVSAIVAYHATNNDNADASFDPSVVEDHTAGARVELPCGRLYASRLSGSGDLTLVVPGRTALFIGGDLAPGAVLRVELGPEGVLDLFVGGNVVSAAPLELGDADAPSRVRLYVGGNGTIQLSGGATFAGNVYAPRAELVTSGDVEVFGSVFVRRVATSGRLGIHYDTAILYAGDDCPPPVDEGCGSCLDCGSSEACIDGVCGECRTSADCCAPFICEGGVCQPDLI